MTSNSGGITPTTVVGTPLTPPRGRRCRVAAEASLPDPMADDGDVGTARGQLLRREAAAQLRPQPEGREQIGEGERRDHPLGPIAS